MSARRKATPSEVVDAVHWQGVAYDEFVVLKPLQGVSAWRLPVISITSHHEGIEVLHLRTAVEDIATSPPAL